MLIPNLKIKVLKVKGKIENAEEKLKEFFEAKGYTCLRPFEVEYFIHKMHEIVPTNVQKIGVPDFIIFKEKKNFKYIECKSKDDGLRFNQLKWFFMYPEFEKEVWYVIEDV